MAVTAAIALAGLGLAVYGAVEKKKAQKKAEANKMPEYKIPQEEYDNLRLAESMANRGMSAQAMNAYTSQADRGLASTQSAIMKNGGSASDISNAQQKYDQGISNIAIYDDQQRQAHLQGLMAQNARMGSFGDKSYQINQYSPWANKSQLYAAQMQGANQTIGQGIGIAANAGMAMGRNMGGGEDQVPKYQGPQGSGSYGGPPSTGAQNNMGATQQFSPNYAMDSAPGNQGGSWGWNGIMPTGGAGNMGDAQGGYQPFYQNGPVNDNLNSGQYGWNGLQPYQY